MVSTDRGDDPRRTTRHFSRPLPRNYQPKNWELLLKRGKAAGHCVTDASRRPGE